MENFSHNEAVAVIKAALESKAITLRGPAGDSTEELAGAADAAYLIELLKGLRSPPQDSKR
ncbi:MAG: hypothetical protein RIQ53_3308 [Pseudomonadota bacterium]|jgi:hypothetical protein